MQEIRGLSWLRELELKKEGIFLPIRQGSVFTRAGGQIY